VGIRNSLPWDELYDLVLNGTLETLYMVFLSGILTIAIWAGLGIVFVACAGFVFFGQKLDLFAILGMVLIVAGVLMINLLSKTAGH